MKLFKYKEYNKHNTSNITYKYLMLSLFSVVICASLLCLTSYAWFTSTTVTSVSSVKAATYNLSYEIINDDETSTSISEPYRIESNSVKFKLTASETSASTGYCVIKVGDDTYYTDQIAAGSSLSFTVTGANGLEITFISYWGTNDIAETDKIIDGSTRSITSSDSSNEPAAASDFEFDIDADTNTETETTDEVTPTDNNADSDDTGISTEDNNSDESTGDINSGTSTGDATNTDAETSGDSPTTDSQKETTNGEQNEFNESEESIEESDETDASSVEQ